MSKIEILQETLHVTHLLKLLDKMCKYKMDPTKTVGTTEQTRDAGQRDGQTDGRTEWNQYTPQQLRCAGGIIKQNHGRNNALPFYRAKHCSIKSLCTYMAVLDTSVDGRHASSPY